MDKIIAQQTDSGRFLIKTSDTKGFVANFETDERFPEMLIDSIVARGYWVNRRNDPKMVRAAKKFKLVESPKNQVR